MTAEQIIETAAAHFNLKPKDLKDKRRCAKYSNARQVAAVLLREMLGLSYPKIGFLLWRDHSSVIWMIDRHQMGFVKGVEEVKTFKVHVYYWPADEGNRELWLGYLRQEGSCKSYVGCFEVEAETRSKAITKAIKTAKEQKK